MFIKRKGFWIEELKKGFYLLGVYDFGLLKLSLVKNNKCFNVQKRRISFFKKTEN